MTRRRKGVEEGEEGLFVKKGQRWSYYEGGFMGRLGGGRQ